jgi:hypothetical protein
MRRQLCRLILPFAHLFMMLITCYALPERHCMEIDVTDAMRRYREGLASRGVRQIQANLGDAMVDWIDQFASEKGLNRSSMIEVLCRLGAATLDEALLDERVSDNGKTAVGDQTSTIYIAPPGAAQLSRFLAPVLQRQRDVHMLYVSALPADGRPLAGRSSAVTVCEWRGASPVQGQRFNPLATTVMPKGIQARRVYVRWLAQVLAPDRGDADAPFPDSTRQLIEETTLALLDDDPNATLENLAELIEAMPWPPAGGGVPGASNKRVIDLLAGQHKGLAQFAGRDEKALTSVIEAARDALAPFRAPELRRFSAADDGILLRFEGAPTTIQVPDAGLRAPTSRLAAMLVTAAIARRLQTKPHVSLTPLIIALEDLGSLPRIPGLEEAITIGHRHGLSVLATAYSFRQIEARYGEATALALRAVARVITAGAATTVATAPLAGGVDAADSIRAS